MTDEQHPKPFVCPDPEVRVGISAIQTNQNAMLSTLTKMESHMSLSNHRIEKLEHASLVDIGRQEERQKWQEREAEEHKAAIDRVYKVMGLALTLGGSAMGAVFWVLDHLL